MPTLEESRAARAAKREANRRRWEADLTNANVRAAAEKAAIQPIPIELPPTTAETGSLGALRAIMADQSAPLHRRLDAAEVVLTYELAPASLISVPTDQVAAASFLFMRAVADNPAAPDALRFRALKNIVAIENARASRTDPDTAVEARLRLISTINSHRRMALAQHNAWPPPAGVRWALAAADDVDLALCAPPPARQLSLSIAETLDRARALDPAERQRQADERHHQLLAITARGRDDTSWRRLITAEPDGKG